MQCKNYFKPSSIEEAYEKLKENPKNALIAGGLWMKKMGQHYETLIDLSTLNLDSVSEDSSNIYVGAMTTLKEFEDHILIKNNFDGVLSFAAKEVMGPAFRNMATVGGSIYGRYAFSDLITALLVFNVTLEFFPYQIMTLEEYLLLKEKVDGILVKIIIKKEKCSAFFKKVKTTALDFALLNICVCKRKDEYFISVGSRSMVAVLAKQAMKLANSSKDYKAIGQVAADELSFTSTAAISKEYRQDLCRVYVARGLMEVDHYEN